VKLGDRVRIKYLDHLAPRWRGKVGEATSIFGEKDPFMYEVTIEGFQLLFFGTELESVKGENNGKN